MKNSTIITIIKLLCLSFVVFTSVAVTVHAIVNDSNL
jgi:hypothetical protein